tara:strand:+ start:10371 stop:11204 length:834 start_codon:yes stop_codon:yes gene_type:complete
LESLWLNYNHNYNYIVYVYYFDDIYDSLDLQKEIIGKTSQIVRFIPIDYKTPRFLSENELFYNRLEIDYVKKHFTIKRKGYLHMCHFTTNMYEYPNTSLNHYDFIMTHDDESGYEQKMDYDPFNILAKSNSLFGAYSFGQRLYNGAPHQGHFDTRINLFEFTKTFILENRIVPKSSLLRKIINENLKDQFHYLEWADTYVIKTEMFKSSSWQLWLNAVNKSGGIYKYRWGDNEIYSLYALIFQGTVLNLNTVNDGYHNQHKYRDLCDIAPSIKNINK